MNNLNWISVVSSNISRIAYNENDQFLYVEFLNGSIYVYKNVPSVIFNELMISPSHGSYLSRQIKPFYPYEKIG